MHTTRAAQRVTACAIAFAATLAVSLSTLNAEERPAERRTIILVRDGASVPDPMDSALASQEAPSPDSPGFRQEIVVTAERAAEDRELVPAATFVLTRPEIEAMPADDLAAIIGRLPGLTTLLEGAGGRPIVTARGFFGGGEVGYVQLLVDGAPVGDPESGLVEWSSIPAETIERVEYLRGPGSALYGDVALGGVIEVFTTPASETPTANLSFEAGSFGTREATVTWRQRRGIDAAISAAFGTTDGYREHGAAERLFADGSLGFAPAGADVGIRLSFASMERDEPGMLPLEILERSPRSSSELFRFDREESNRFRASVDYARSGDIPWRVVAWVNDRETSLLRTVLLAAGLGDRSQRQIATQTVGGSLTAEYSGPVAGRPNRLRGGIDASHDGVESDYFAVAEDGLRGGHIAVGDGARDRFALFASNHLELTPRTRLTLGARYDRLRDRFATATTHEAWSPRVGVNVRLDALEGRPYVLFAQAARAFKAPTIDQLFDQRPYPDFTGGSFTVSNPNLVPQRATNLELGVSRSTAVLRWELVGYRMEVDDEIDFDVATFSYRNIGESLHQGLEASAEWRLQKATPRVSYTWTSVEAVGGEHPGRQLKNIPRHVVYLGSRLDLPFRLQVDASLRLIQGWFLDDANSVPMGDSSQLDVRVSRELGAWTGRIDVLNVLDDVVPHVGVVLPDFRGGEVPYAYPSAGRSVRVGVERRF